jgi:hypothetical protein
LAIAGLLLAARTWLDKLELPAPSVTDVLQATGASRSRAYEVREDLQRLLPGLLRPPGRPPSQPVKPDLDRYAALSGEVLAFVMDHSGCVSGGDDRRRYSDGFRHRILELREEYQDLGLEDFAEAVRVPLGTLNDWLRAGTPPRDHATKEPLPQADQHADEARFAKIQTVLEAWRSWCGDFTSFCEHVRVHLRLDGFGDSMISSILSELGERRLQRRGGRSRDEEAIRKTFRTFFPDAQWVGDGTEVAVTIDGTEHRFNFELIVDAFSGAFVGTCVRDAEDSKAVTEAFAQGVATTGGQPLGLLLDNRPSNHTAEVDQALGETLRMRSTPGRAQNKAHVEGAFGLFSQRAPDLTLETQDPRELAKGVVRIVVELFARILNGRPCKGRAGKSRIELHQQDVSDDESKRALAALQDRVRQQEAARATREARTNPAARTILDRAFERLGLLDPERFFRRAIACYSLDAIANAIATFEGRHNAGTLPEGVDARYLLGIVRNIEHLHESEAITEALIRERLAARDILLRALEDERAAICADGGSDLHLTFVDRTLAADRNIDRCFWIDAAAQAIVQQPEADRSALFKAAARRIHKTFRATRELRYETERRLARLLWPLD